MILEKFLAASVIALGLASAGKQIEQRQLLQRVLGGGDPGKRRRTGAAADSRRRRNPPADP